MSRVHPARAAVLVSCLLAPGTASAAPECTQIEDGTIRGSDGAALVPGEDGWGYDYQAHTFQGDYCASNRQLTCANQGVDTAMVWNDAWLSNQDCDHDGKLDAHYGFATFRGSAAEMHGAMHGRYTSGDGKPCEYYYYYRYVAAPLDARKSNSQWYASDGTLLGGVVWTDFYVAQTSYNTVCFEGDPPPSE